MKDLSLTERKYISNIVKKVFYSKINEGNFKPTDTYFPASGFGSLSEKSPQSLMVEEDVSFPSDKKIKIIVRPNIVESTQKAFSNYPFIQVVPLTRAPWEITLSDQPEALMLSIDSLFGEDLSLIYYSFHTHIFGTEKAGETFLGEYIKLPNAKDRNKKLSQLHKKFLEKYYVTPIGLAPYISFGTPEYVYNLSKISVSLELWKIQVH